MAFDIQGAKDSGYSDDEISEYLAKDSGFDVVGAKNAGYTPSEIIQHLSTREKPKGIISSIAGGIKSLYSGSSSTEPEEYSDPIGTGNTSSAATREASRSTYKSVMDDYTSTPNPYKDPMLEQKFVDDFKQKLAEAPIEKRLNALKAYAKTDDAYGRAAKVILAEEEYKNNKVTEEGKKEAMALQKLPKTLPPKLGKGQPQDLSFPNAEQSWFESMDGVTPESIAKANAMARGIGDSREAEKLQPKLGEEASAAEYLAGSAKSGVLSLAAATAKIANDIFLVSESDIAKLYKDDSEGLDKVLNESPATYLMRVAKNRQKDSGDVMQDLSKGTKEYYGEMKYDTLSEDKSAWRSPIKIAGDAIQSLPTSLAMGATIVLTRGASKTAVSEALAKGLSQEAAKAAGILAASKTMSYFGAASEGIIGYAQQANETRNEADLIKDEVLEKSIPYQKLIQQGYTPKAARVLVSANAASEAGIIAGIVDGATNLVAGKFLGKVIGEGGKPIAAAGKAFVTEGLTEAIQSPGEKYGQNLAVQKNLSPDQKLSEGLVESSLQGLAVGGFTGAAMVGASNARGGVESAVSVARRKAMADMAAQGEAYQAAPQTTPADILSPKVTSADEAIVKAQESISTPASADIGSVITAAQEKAVSNIADILGNKSADEQLISQIRAAAPLGSLDESTVSPQGIPLSPKTGEYTQAISETAANKIAEQAINTPATPSFEVQNEQTPAQAQAVEAGALERVEATGQSTTDTTARADVLETTRVNDANTVQANPNPNAPASTVPTDAGRTVYDGGVLPAARLEPTVQSEPAPVQSLPQAQPKASLDPRLIPVSQRKADLTEPQRQQINAANEQQLEDLYQQDVKDAISARLGRPVKTKSSAGRTAFKSFLREHGINSAVASDVTGERGIRANAKLPATFRRNGLNLDLLAERAVEAGFMTQAELDSSDDNGGTNRLVQMIQAEIAGKPQETLQESNESNEAQSERIQRAEIESMADKLGLPYDGDTSTDRLASMVKRVSDRLEAENLKSWGETKVGKLKEERVLQQAKEFAARIERKRVQYERELDEFAEANIKVQDAVLEVLYDADGNPTIVRQADIQAETAWNELNGQWEGQNGQTNTTADGTAQETGTPDNQGARASPENAGQNSTEPQQSRAAEEGLTAPTREDILAQQARAEQAEKDKAAADKAAEKAAKEAANKKEIDARQQASAENFQLGQSAEDSLSGQASMFDAAESPATGEFGPILTQFKGDAQGAIKALTEIQDGEAVAALNHPEVGDIDLVWGKEGTKESNGSGLAKLVKWHPEVLDDLQGIVASLKVVERTENRIQLESETHKAAVRLEWDGKAKHWLLTAFEKRSVGGGTRTDITANGVGDDTARPKSDTQSITQAGQAAKPASEMSVQDLLRAAADKMDNAAKPTIQGVESIKETSDKVFAGMDAAQHTSEAARIRQAAQTMRERGMPDVADKYNTLAENHEIAAKQKTPLASAKATASADKGVAMFSRATSLDATPEGKAALEALSKNDALFALPKSDKTDIQGIADDNEPGTKVRITDLISEKMYTLTFPDGQVARITERAHNPRGEQLYGYTTQDGEMGSQITERPGVNPDEAPAKDDVWLDVSLLKPGKKGAMAYNIAATYAHNNGKIFIGDPAGLTDTALRRRTEQMISSALKFGTTDHLAPHPRQVEGSAALGVPPLEWIYGDSVGNIERMIDVSRESLQNAFPDAQKITYDPSTGNFRTGTGRNIPRELLAARAKEDKEDLSGGRLAEAKAGWRTVARNAVFTSLLEMDAGKERERGRLLDRLGGNVAGLSARGDGSGAYEARDRLFYSRGESTNTDTRVASKDQSDAIRLNRTMANHFNDATWNNAYEQVNLPDALSDYAAAASAAFDARIVAIRPTGAEFDQFNGINVNGTNFINVDANVSFINTTGHEVYHDIEKNRPDLHEWFKEQAQAYYKDFDSYQNRLNALVGKNENAYTREAAQSELLADFTGDALADTKFLQKLAEDNPSKFKDMLRHVIAWLKNISSNFSKKDLGSSKYFTDVEALRKHLNQVLLAYASNTPIERMAAMQAPEFSREQATSKPLQTDTPAFKALAEFLSSAESARDMISTGNKSAMDGLQRDAKNLTNLLEGLSGSTHSNSHIQIPQSVVTHMLNVADNKQVLGAIIRAIPIDVMNFLAGQKLSAKSLLSDKTMLEDIFSKTGGSNVPLQINKAAFSLANVVARTATEFSNLTKRAREESVTNSTTNTDLVFSTHGNSITKNENFSKWFGDSKVVDAQGKPLVVYHGTSKSFDVFDAAKAGATFKGDDSGIYFTNLANEPDSGASAYANYSKSVSKNDADAANVMPVYLSFKNPLVISEDMERGAIHYADNTRSDIRRWVKNGGYDSVIIEDTSSDYESLNGGSEKVFIAFNPEQIKSATGNNGNFDASNPDIRFARNATDAVPANSDIRDSVNSPAIKQSPWLDSTGRLKFAPGQVAYDMIGKAINPILIKTQMKMANPKLRQQLRDMKLEVQKAQEKAVAVTNESMKLSDGDRLMVSDIIEKELKSGVTPPAHAVQLAAIMNSEMSKQSQELIRLGMLSPDAVSRLDGEYLPRFYESKLTNKAGDVWADAMGKLRGKTSPMKGITGKSLHGRGMYKTIPESDLKAFEQLGWEVRDPDYNPSLPTVDGQVQVWRDYTRKERDDMGEIRDAGFRFVMGYMQSQKDIALGRMFEGMAKDPESSSRLAQDGWVKVPETKIDGTGAKRYGMLAGRYVPKETMSHLSQIEETQSEAWQMYRKAMGLWKEGKTVLNPGSHVNNIVSNLTMAHLAGVSYHRADAYIGAMKDFITKAPMLKEANDAGLFLGSMSDAELMKVLPDELQAMVLKGESTGLRGVKFVYNAMTFFLRKPLGKAYQAEDTFFRYLLYKDARQRGANPSDSIEKAQAAIFTYDDLPKGARMIRDFGIPFFAYTYKAAPMLLHTALAYPHRMLAPMAIGVLANAAAYALAFGDDDDDWMDKLQKYATDSEHRKKVQAQEESEEKDLPSWMRGSVWLPAWTKKYIGVTMPKAIRLGVDEVTGMPLFLDVSRLFPGGDLMDVHANVKGALPLPQPITPSHPVLSMLGGLMANKDLFTGKELIDLNDDSEESAKKRMAWLWRNLSPAITVGNAHWERGMSAIAQASGGEITWIPDALGGDATGIGKDGNPVQPKYAIMQTFGIKVRPIDLSITAKFSNNDKEAMIKSLDMEIAKQRRLYGMNAIKDKTFETEVEKLNTKKERIITGLTIDGDEKE